MTDASSAEPWTAASRRAEAMRAPIGTHLSRPGLRIVERPGWYQKIVPSVKNGAMNEIIVSRLSDAEADEVIDRTMAEYASLGVAFRWLVGPDTTPADLGLRLERRGFVRWDARAMTIDPRAWPAPDERELAAQAAEVDESSIEAYCSVAAEGWKLDPAEERRLLGALLADPARRHHWFLARADGKPAATAGYVDHPRSVYLIGAVVLPELRARGLYRALIGARLRQAASRGFTLATTQAREATSAPILEALGFETACRFRMYATVTPA